MLTKDRLIVGVIVFAAQFFSTLPCTAQVEADGLNVYIETEGDAVSAGPLGAFIEDFGNAQLSKEKFEELDPSHHNQLGELVERLRIGKDCLGVAVFLNQKFPDKKFVPISNRIAIADRTAIPLDFWLDGKKVTAKVSSETFGQVFYDYWRQHLDIDDRGGKKAGEK